MKTQNTYSSLKYGDEFYYNSSKFGVDSFKFKIIMVNKDFLDIIVDNIHIKKIKTEELNNPCIRKL